MRSTNLQTVLRLLAWLLIAAFALLATSDSPRPDPVPATATPTPGR